jgi:iduronate 2-sulfatase
VRTDRFRHVEWKSPGGADSGAIFELYDYVADPEEAANLAARKPEIVAELRALLARQPQPKPQWTPSSDPSEMRK